MQKSFDGLCGIVRNELGKTISDKDIFIFLNKWCTHVKLLLAEQDGYTLFYGRLHKRSLQRDSDR
ncbi:IS66 family insertion sequence element accessory protein TnpB [Paraflavitalea speifideaquila]|uniref:IS66 family insertion sequence element accessory protein TnpB n=1 Tax=Paraflavitalea speifideaquila TaxID=3076558 RepID=UPI0028E993D1|nr:IS66 family insertion sequence element accessory protein TnpB [Paraflavitalea speifideiaquila]